MVLRDRRGLRERFDDGRSTRPTPPMTHRCDRYLATDAAIVDRRAGFGAIVETSDGERIARWRRPGRVSDNNAAELLALHFGLDRIAQLPNPPTRLGILLDHDALAEGVTACVTGSLPSPVAPPMRGGSRHHWGGIRARLAAIPDVRVAVVEGNANPAHRLANGVAAD